MLNEDKQTDTVSQVMDVENLPTCGTSLNRDTTNKVTFMSETKIEEDSETAQSKNVCHTSHLDLKCSPVCDEEQKDMDFNNFEWKSETNDENINTEEMQCDGTLKLKQKLSPNKSDTEVCPVKKYKLAHNGQLISNRKALGLIHMPTDIPLDDIPSRYPKPIQDALNLTAEERIEFAERRRIEKETQNDEDPTAAKYGRLHPDNASFNQGPVINPPPISPRSLVTFTPAGQRFEIDLNQGRPTYFRSEYSRMMYDGATLTNHKKMMHGVKEGSYLPTTLSDDIERRHIAEQRFVETLMSEYVKRPETSENEEESGDAGNVEGGVKTDCTEAESNIENGSGIDDDGDIDEASSSSSDESFLQSLSVELQFLNFHHNVTVMLHDRHADCVRQLQEIACLDLRPSLFKKNPQLVDLVGKLMNQTEFPELQIIAVDLYDKIKSLFEVPEGMDFEQYFQTQAAQFREQASTTGMNALSQLLYHELPEEIPDTDSSLDESEEEDPSPDASEAEMEEEVMQDLSDTSEDVHQDEVMSSSVSEDEDEEAIQDLVINEE